MRFACAVCGSAYPSSELPYRCPLCGGTYDFAGPLVWAGEDRNSKGLARFRPTLGDEYCSISLGECDTPLIPAAVQGRVLHFKCEYANPSGSFKDRGAAALLSYLSARSVQDAIEDSSGNAGAAFAAYAAHAGIQATVYVPGAASGAKRRQIEGLGARLVLVAGPRSEAELAARRAADGGAVYASHAYLPQQVLGYATCAFEIYGQLHRAPGCVVVPVGQGGLLLGLFRGFSALRSAGVIERLPMLIGVQGLGCAPLAASFDRSISDQPGFATAKSIAEGASVQAPLRSAAVLAAVRDSAGFMLAAPEELILRGRDALARLGFYVEPTSALVWHAVEAALTKLPEPVVLVLTGSGYKTEV